ncbi:MAG: response regulator transcription factor [Thiogranum sp.]
MKELYTAPQDLTDISNKHSIDRIRILIIGQRDFSVDGLASMLEARDSNYLVTCIEPDNALIAKPAAAAGPDALLIQNEILREPLERFIHSLIGEYPDARILVFGKNMDDDHLYRLVRTGIHGYIKERMSGDDIKHALDCVIDGNTWIERHILERFISTQHDFDAALKLQFYSKIERLCSSLTKRETEILCEVVKGLAIKQIAEQVHLSHQGVKMHLAKLFRKFKVSNRNQLILAAFDEMSPVEDLSLLLHKGLKKKLHS